MVSKPGCPLSQSMSLVWRSSSATAKSGSNFARLCGGSMTVSGGGAMTTARAVEANMRWYGKRGTCKQLAQQSVGRRRRCGQCHWLFVLILSEWCGRPPCMVLGTCVQDTRQCTVHTYDSNGHMINIQFLQTTLRSRSQCLSSSNIYVYILLFFLPLTHHTHNGQ
jgi:hypothetical protein